MAASVQVYQYFVVDIDGQSHKGGSLTQPKSIALGDGEIADQLFKVGPETAVKIWDAVENAEIGSFDFIWVESDLDVLIQSTTGVGVTDAYDVKTLKGSGTAGVMGPALVLGSDVTQILDGSVDLFDGTADVLEEIWVKNEDSTETARIRLIVAT